MFLTTFDKKMYEEAMRLDGRQEELENTERERKRAEESEKRVNKLERQNKQLCDELARLRRKVNEI